MQIKTKSLIVGFIGFLVFEGQGFAKKNAPASLPYRFQYNLETSLQKRFEHGTEAHHNAQCPKTHIVKQGSCRFTKLSRWTPLTLDVMKSAPAPTGEGWNCSWRARNQSPSARNPQDPFKVTVVVMCERKVP